MDKEAIKRESLFENNQRLLSLDVFRGITIAAMILVNNPGDWSSVYSPLRHAKWHGWTPTDLIFPFFLFIAGVSLVFSFSTLKDKSVPSRQTTIKILKRSLILFALGLVLAAFPFFRIYPEFEILPKLEKLRIMGVLQRIAICYLLVSLVYFYFRPRMSYILLFISLFGYWALMTFVPVPGYGVGVYDDPGNLGAYLDRLILGEHRWHYKGRIGDPEGLLGTLPAMGTMLLGIWSARLMILKKPKVEITVQLFARGFILITLGYIWNYTFPINKNIWTSSYVLFTGGIAICFLALCYWSIEIKNWRKWARPFEVYGMNAIIIYFLSGIQIRLFYLIKFQKDTSSKISLKEVIYDNVYSPFFSSQNASLLYALTSVLFFLGIAWIMYNRKIFVKV